MGQLVLVKLYFFAVKDELAYEDLLIGLPVLRKFRIESRTLLESRRTVLNGVD